jgi:hypothetical protein
LSFTALAVEELVLGLKEVSNMELAGELISLITKGIFIFLGVVLIAMTQYEWMW